MTTPEGWHLVTATCRNPPCPKCDEPVPGILVPDNPEEYGWTGVYCGVCGQQIDDLTTETVQ